MVTTSPPESGDIGFLGSTGAVIRTAIDGSVRALHTIFENRKIVLLFNL